MRVENVQKQQYIQTRFIKYWKFLLKIYNKKIINADNILFNFLAQTRRLSEQKPQPVSWENLSSKKYRRGKTTGKTSKPARLDSGVFLVNPVRNYIPGKKMSAKKSLLSFV